MLDLDGKLKTVMRLGQELDRFTPAEQDKIWDIYERLRSDKMAEFNAENRRHNRKIFWGSFLQGLTGFFNQNTAPSLPPPPPYPIKNLADIEVLVLQAIKIHSANLHPAPS